MLSGCAFGIGTIAPRSLARLTAAADNGRNSLTSRLLDQPRELGSVNVGAKVLGDSVVGR